MPVLEGATSQVETHNHNLWEQSLYCSFCCYQPVPGVQDIVFMAATNLGNEKLVGLRSETLLHSGTTT